jgi:hypothetical protein
MWPTRPSKLHLDTWVGATCAGSLAQEMPNGGHFEIGGLMDQFTPDANTESSKALICVDV